MACFKNVFNGISYTGLLMKIKILLQMSPLNAFPSVIAFKYSHSALQYEIRAASQTAHQY